jgi:type I restriction enzyme S subunit
MPVPPHEEQRAIAGALGDVDALIAALDQLIAKKGELKRAAMQQLLTPPAPGQARQTRLPGFSGEWEVKRLGEIALLYQPVTISAKQFTESGYPVYGANGVVGFYREFNHNNWQVTVTCRGSTCGTVNRTVDRCWITGNAMVVNCDNREDVDKSFLYYLLLSRDLSICITGTGQPQIVRGPLADFSITFPANKIEQAAIAAVLSDMDAEIAALERRLAKTRALKQGMMQELLTGRTRLI